MRYIDMEPIPYCRLCILLCNLMEVGVILTISDIAKQAGVAKSTVSRTINNSGYVKEETRQKIMQIIEENKYIPSANARGLSKQESKLIGVVIPELGNEFYAEILRGIIDVLEDKGLTMVLCNTDNNSLREQKSLKLMKEHRVKGVILSPSGDYPAVEGRKKFNQLIEDLNVPVMMLDRWLDNSTWDGVYTDNLSGSYKATEALINEGNRKIAVITGDLSLSVGRERFNGYKLALKDRGLEYDPALVYEGDFTQETAYYLAKKLLAEKELPDAVLLCNNKTSTGFIRAALEGKVVIGQDIACIGFDYVEIADVVFNNFSYLERDATNMGRAAARFLLEKIESGNQSCSEHILQPHLVLKGSQKKKIM